jgi:UDP-GlcNAc3NAcA epimerase
MIRILTIIGARPQIIKASALSRAIRKHFSDQVEEIIVHTGQHYDDNMSEVFFRQLEVPPAKHNLNVGSATHGVQTARMIEGIEALCHSEKPDFVVVYGDTNSTLAGAIAAAKLHIPIAHIEAGLRSYNKTMPEEINRIVCDHLSTLLFSPTATGLQNLIKEGMHPDNNPPFTSDNPRIYHCGDVMLDNSLYFAEAAEQQSDILQQLQLDAGEFILATIHRDNNTDDPERLGAIFSALNSISLNTGKDVIIPLHPRTAKLLKANLGDSLFEKISLNPHIRLLPPASFFDMLVLEKNCSLVMTDSGGVQKEAYFFNKACIIFRPETEWVEIIEQGAGRICDADPQRILDAFAHYASAGNLHFPPIFGDGEAARFICREILKASE